MLQVIERAAVFVRNLPVPAQWAVLSVAKAFGGSIILAFAANYATAYFAIRHGFRVPLEGVPYLSFAVGIAGFATFLLAMPLFLLFVIFAQHIRHGIFGSGLSGRQASIVSYIVLAMLLVMFAVSVALFRNDATTRNAIEFFLPTSFPESKVTYVSGVLMGATVFSLLAMWTVAKGFGWIGAQVQAWVFVLLAAFVGLFWYDSYGSFLRLIRYGGGIEVTVRKLAAIATPGERMQYDSKLLWVTESHVVLFDSTNNLVEEIPRSTVAAIIYRPTPAWDLPERMLDKQGEYLKFDPLEAATQADVPAPPELSSRGP